MSTRHRKAAAGFSLVELMVSIVIGMLALVFATRMLLVSEENKDISLGGSDSMQNGMQALLALKDDLEQSGFGLNDPIINGCDTVFKDAAGFQLATAKRGAADITPLTSVVINAVPGGSDKISIYSGTSHSGTGSVRMTVSGSGGTPTIDRMPFGFTKGDIVVAANEKLPSATKCKLAQITNDPQVQNPHPAAPVLVINGAARFNSSMENPVWIANESRLFNLGPAGSLSFHSWNVDKGFLMLRATNMDGSVPNGSVVVDNIVAIKAQYGFDTRSNAQFAMTKGMQKTGLRVSVWSAEMIDADGDGTAGDHDDWTRVASVRVAIVARGRNVQRVKGAASCDATTEAPALFATAEPVDVAAVPVTPNLQVAGDLDWRCYRYRKFETIVPLRNTGWRPTAFRPT